MEANNSNNLFNENLSSDEQKPQNLDDMLIAYRQQWTNEITNLNEMMKSVHKVDELLTIVYSKRQTLVDYYYGMNSVILKQTNEYKKLYNDMYNNIKLNGYNGMRIATDQNINRLIESELIERKNTIDALANHNSFVKDTISTIDNIIYGINQKIKLHCLLNGISNI